MMGGTLALFWWQLDRSGSLESAQTVALTTMVMYQMAHAFNARAEYRADIRMKLLGNSLLLVTVAATITLHVGATYFRPTQQLLGIEPIDPVTWLTIMVAVSAIIVVVKIHKRMRPRPLAEGATSNP